MARGGKREGAGRPKGALARATIEQKATLVELARSHTEAAFGVLLDVMRNSQSDSARIAAASAVLDRGYGRAAQAMELSGPDAGPMEVNVNSRDLARAVLGILREAEIKDSK